MIYWYYSYEKSPQLASYMVSNIFIIQHTLCKCTKNLSIIYYINQKKSLFFLVITQMWQEIKPIVKSTWATFLTWFKYCPNTNIIEVSSRQLYSVIARYDVDLQRL